MTHGTDKPKSRKPSVPSVQSLERAAQILLAFRAEQPALSLADLSRHVELSKSTVRRLLLTLEDLQLVKAHPATQTYSLGATCLRLGYVAHLSMDVRSIARPRLELLTKQTGETSYLFVQADEGAVCVDIVEAYREVRVVQTAIGTVFPLHIGAASRALMSEMDDDAIRAMASGTLKRFTPFSLVDARPLIEDAHLTRKRGVCQSFDDLVQGAAGIGAVLRNHEGKIAGAISIGGLKDRFVGEQLENMSEAVRRAVLDISKAMGFHST